MHATKDKEKCSRVVFATDDHMMANTNLLQYLIIS